MEYPLSELVDRKTILMLKLKYANKPQRFQQEFNEIDNAIKDYNYKENGLSTKLLKINEKIWNLESDIRKGNDWKFSFEEIGRRALLIRDYNKKRVAIKNRIAKAVGQFREYKV
jgi:hypothetical protein